MAEHTDLECASHDAAMAVDEYLRTNVKDDVELGRIDSVVVKSTVRITYLDLDRNHHLRHGVDMQLLGFRDGYTAGKRVMKPLHNILSAAVFWLCIAAWIVAVSVAQ